jgi:hypothetical protein
MRHTWLNGVMVLMVAMVSWSLSAAADESGQEQQIAALRAKAEALIDRAAKLKADGKQDDARELAEQAARLRREADELAGARKQAGEKEKAAKSGEAPQKTSPGAQFENELKEIHARIKELLAAGREDEARALHQKAEELAQHHRRQSVAQHLAEVERKAQQLREAGHADEAEKLLQRARQFVEAQRDPVGGAPEHAGEVIKQRIQHLQVAAENLAAAGFPDQADEIRRRIEALKQGGKELRPVVPHGGEHHPGALKSGEPRPAPELAQHIRELNERVRRLEAMIEKLIAERK